MRFSPPDAPERRGKWQRGGSPLPMLERTRKYRAKLASTRKRDIAILDMETDPFDNGNDDAIFPFLAVLYSDQFDTIVIWEEDHERFIAAVIATIAALPRKFTIYAHNGGKFDFLFLISALRGDVRFKGRGIMSARVGKHDLRDSFHIIPEKLAAYQKDVFDYTQLRKQRRANFRDQIIAYCIADCRYLLELVRAFIDQFGLKLSIGQAAMAKIKEHYTIEKFSAGWDAYVRKWYFGGRVQCLQGAGDFTGDYKLIDVNSLYPYVMATYNHPIGGFYDYTITQGPVCEQTAFVKLRCKNRNALIARAITGETTAAITEGVFHTTIHEYRTALQYGLISDVEIIECLDCREQTRFDKFVDPLYANRIATKQAMGELKAAGKVATTEYTERKKDDIFYKLLLNNGYGKFCQNPARFREHYLTDPDEQPEAKWFDSVYEAIEDAKIQLAMVASQDEERIASKHLADLRACLQPNFESERYWIWRKPSPSMRFNNVGTGASITGAARAVLLEALQHTRNAIYCDTDSIICESFDDRIHVHASELGAWDLEDEFTRVLIAGKKLYGVWHKKPKARTASELERGLDPCYTIKSKGTAGMTWDELRSLLGGNHVVKKNAAPTLTKYGEQRYISRSIRATAPAADLQAWLINQA
jgi:DNA polymerase type B, organellar and viral